MNYVLFITGPTASGKTDFSIQIAEKLSQQSDVHAEIINADIGQFYTPLSIGTAKPDWESFSIKHHLFDIVDEPKDFNVVAYRDLLIKTVKDIWARGKIPIVVGGSLFYIRSLFFLPKGGEEGPGRSKSEAGGDHERLRQIDPERAKAIHPSDTYRIQRALAIWEATGKKPSEQVPEFKPEFRSRIIFIDLPRDLLFERINRRTEQMIHDDGWIDEAKNFQGTEWEPFLKEKKLIGYPEIFAWLDEQGSKEALIAKIQKNTRNYAKRQVTFWKKFRTLLMDHATGSGYLCQVGTVHATSGRQVEEVVMQVGKDLDFVKGDR